MPLLLDLGDKSGHGESPALVIKHRVLALHLLLAEANMGDPSNKSTAHL